MSSYWPHMVVFWAWLFFLWHTWHICGWYLKVSYTRKQVFFFLKYLLSFQHLACLPQGRGIEMLDVLRQSWLILGKKFESWWVLWWVCDVIAGHHCPWGKIPFHMWKKVSVTQSSGLNSSVPEWYDYETSPFLNTICICIFRSVCASISISSISISSIYMYVCIYTL